MNIDTVDCELNENWHSVFNSKFLIIPATRELNNVLREKSVNQSVSLDDLIESIVKYSLKSWLNVQNAKGEFIAYNHEEAVKALKAVPSLLQFVLSKTFKV